MADQIPRIKSKWLISQFKTSRLCIHILMVGLWVLTLSICSVQTATCPSSVSPSLATTTEQYNFSEYTTTEGYGVTVGPVSGSLYYMYHLSTPSDAATVRKVDPSGSQTWMASFAFYPTVKSLSVDVVEQSVYLASFTDPTDVLKLAASDGSIVSQHRL